MAFAVLNQPTLMAGPCGIHDLYIIMTLSRDEINDLSHVITEPYCSMGEKGEIRTPDKSSQGVPRILANIAAQKSVDHNIT